jgi:hypothetical protein
MSAIDEIVGQIPMDRLASQLGVDPQTAEAATREAVPALLGGMQANAQDPQGAASLAEALGQHENDLLDGGVDLAQVNPDDGGKIVGHVFGANQEQVVNQLGGLGGSGGSSVIGKLLPMLAPVVMAYLAKQFTQKTSSAAAPASGSGTPDLGGLLGSLLGGGGGSITDMLGGLLGAGRR